MSEKIAPIYSPSGKQPSMANVTSLHEEALLIVEELALLDRLEPFGTVQLVGSVALDLVVKPDIDIHLLLDDSQDVLTAAREIFGMLITHPEIDELRITDYLEIHSLKLGIDRYPGNLSDWSIDLWITSDVTTTGFQDLEEFREKLDENKKHIILTIKRAYHRKGLLEDGLSSRVYRAVLDEGVSNLEEFEKTIRDQNE